MLPHEFGHFLTFSDDCPDDEFAEWKVKILRMERIVEGRPLRDRVRTPIRGQRWNERRNLADKTSVINARLSLPQSEIFPICWGKFVNQSNVICETHHMFIN